MDVAGASALLADALAAGIRSRGSATLALPGGSSPVPIFECLRGETAVDWGRVTITLVDDRAVPPDHPDSNHGLLLEHLLCEGSLAAAARFVPLYGNPDAQSMIALPIDAILLGMGGDGHFASLFPDMIDDEVAFSRAAEAQIIETDTKGSPPFPRITMNLAMICKARRIVLVLPDAGKKAIFEASKTDATLPVHHLTAALGDRLQVFS